ncbi:MAG TPA: SAM-dependent methyltransferase [Streptosporangiaceae bacterium]|nr:SAM-dependent methyltransferase [Streptosporangiaceae bacterium]
MEDGGPSVTARRVAAHRLAFTRVTADYGDPAADEALAADVVVGLTVSASRMHDYLAARTAFFDRAVTGAIDRGVRQIVTGAAGYDGRALRYARPDVRWFEADHPATQRDKLGRLERLGITAPGVTFVEADFTRDPLADRLREAGLDPAVPSLFLLEGVAAYLEPVVLWSVLVQFRQLAAPGSQLAISVSVSLGAGDVNRARFEAAVAAMGEPVRSRFAAGQAEDLLARTGWQVADSGRAGTGRGVADGAPAGAGRGTAAARRERLRSAGLLMAAAGPGLVPVLRTRPVPMLPPAPAPAPHTIPGARLRPARPRPGQPHLSHPCRPRRTTAPIGSAIPGAGRVHGRTRQRGRARHPAPHHRRRARLAGRRGLADVAGHVGELHALRGR